MSETWHYVHDMAINEDATVVVHANASKHLWVRRFPTGEVIAEHDLVHSFGGRRLALSPDGSRLCTGCYEGGVRQKPHGSGVRCYETVTGQLLWERPDLLKPQIMLCGPGPEMVTVCRAVGGASVVRWSDGATVRRIRSKWDVSFQQGAGKADPGRADACFVSGFGSRSECRDANDKRLWKATIPGPPPKVNDVSTISEEGRAAVHALGHHDPDVYGVCWPPGLLVLAETGGDIWAFDDRGVVRWTFPRESEESHSYGLSYDADRGQILTYGYECLHSIDPATGWENWKVSLPPRRGIRFETSARRGSLLVGPEYFFDAATREIKRYARVFEDRIWTQHVSKPWHEHVLPPTQADLRRASEHGA
ncbi:MAG: hypothetical protein HEQ23_03370 [Tepidisphaera sp.]